MRIAETVSLVQLLVLLLVIGAIVGVPIWLWQHFRPPAPVRSDPAVGIELPPPVIPDRREVPVIVPSGADTIRTATLAVRDPQAITSTITVLDSTGSGTVIALREIRPRLLSDFRLIRQQRVRAEVLGTVGGASGSPSAQRPRVYQTQQRLALLQLELRGGLGMGYTGRAAPYASATGLRVWGFHLGAFAGVELGTADLLVGPYVRIRPWGSLGVGAGWAPNQRAWMLGLETTF